MPDPAANALAGRRLLLGVTGGIAAYKSADLVRRLKEAGADVQVVMTAGAEKFITALTFQAVSGRAVRDSLWDESAEAAMGHIELARWPDAILVAPASANFLAQLAQGVAGDLLTTLCLASDRPIFVAPAMNRLMWANAATRQNLETLRARGVTVLGPGSGDQACGEVGEGRMLEPAEIRDALTAHLRNGPLSGTHAVVTAGPTREAIDPVRVLTNRSSGKMGYAVAGALSGLGARVTLVSGPVAITAPRGVSVVSVESAAQMLQASLDAAGDAQIFVGAAAIADYAPAAPAPQKIKKKADSLELSLARTQDVLGAVRARHPRLFMVGFAAETEKLEEHAREKLAKKKLDLVAANLVGYGRAFDRDDNELRAFWNDGHLDLGRAPKPDLARRLADLIAEHYTRKKAG